MKIRAQIMALKSLEVARKQGEAANVGVTPAPRRASNSTAENLGDAVGNAINATLNLATAILETAANGMRAADEKLFGGIVQEYLKGYLEDGGPENIEGEIKNLEAQLAKAEKEEGEEEARVAQQVEKKLAKKAAEVAADPKVVAKAEEEERKRVENEAKERERREAEEKERKEAEERAKKEAKEKEERKRQEKIDESKNTSEAKEKHAERAKKPENKYKDDSKKLNEALTKRADAAAESVGDFFALVEGGEAQEGEEVNKEVAQREEWKKVEKEKAEKAGEVKKMQEADSAAESVGDFFALVESPEWKKEVESEIRNANSGDKEVGSTNVNEEEKKEESFLGKVAAAIGEVFNNLVKKLTEKDPISKAAKEAMGGNDSNNDNDDEHDARRAPTTNQKKPVDRSVGA